MMNNLYPKFKLLVDSHVLSKVVILPNKSKLPPPSNSRSTVKVWALTELTIEIDGWDLSIILRPR